MIGLNITVRDNGVAEEIGRDVDNLIGEFVAKIEANFRRTMTTGTRSGRLYRKGRFDGRSRVGGQRPQGKGNRIHRASAPGEPLATDTGRTLKTWSVRRLKSGVYRIRIGGGAAFWELRAKDARPTLLPSIEAAAEEIFG